MTVKLINYLKSFLYFFIPLIILLLIATLLYYFNIINNDTMGYLKIIIVILSTILGGFKIGNLATDKGYLKGIVFGVFICIIFFLISLITKSIRFQQIIYYIIIIITSTLGSIIGINKKASSN